MDKLTCMLDIYKECKRYLNLTSNGIIAANIKEHMEQDQWDTFNTGSELCGKTLYFLKDIYVIVNID